ncbi:MAG: DUF2244 domain-containing protein [Candidatus Thiodiazotropha sp. (ex Monitilora ramsayi)]|nr:DUF2244 domain-containing protein [Candidatus Thiodiazotropha sp. (ex Monitilora ramsayi)]
MVRSDVQIGSRSTQTVFIVEQNRNLSWRQSKWLFLFLAACIATVSLYFASLGAWLVLPFTGLEILLVGGAIYAQSCCAHRKQIIRVDQTQVEIDEPPHRNALKSFPKAWSKVIQIRDSRGWYPSRLLIGSHGEFVEIGKYLIDDEREQLAHQLRCAIEGA